MPPNFRNELKPLKIISETLKNKRHKNINLERWASELANKLLSKMEDRPRDDVSFPPRTLLRPPGSGRFSCQGHCLTGSDVPASYARPSSAQETLSVRLSVPLL